MAIAAIAAKALPWLGEAIGATVLPAMAYAFGKPEGPSEEDIAKVNETLDAQAARLAGEHGIPLDKARLQVEQELAPLIDRHASSDPSFMQGLLQNAALMYAGGKLGGAVSRKVGGARAGATMQKGMDLKNRMRERAPMKAPAKPATAPEPIQTIPEEAAEGGLSNLDEFLGKELNVPMSGGPTLLDLDEILKQQNAAQAARMASRY